MKIVLGILLCSFITAAKTLESNSSSLDIKIVGGMEVPPDELTFLVSLRRIYGYIYCAGSLISELHVLTAAHCIYYQSQSRNFSGIYIVVGFHKVGKGNGVRHLIRYLDHHEDYVPGKRGSRGDIGIVTLKKSVDLSSPFVSLIYLPTSADVPDGAVATTAGWGAIHTYKGNETFVKVDILTKIDVEIYNHDLCQKVFVSRIIYENQICVKGITDTVNVNTGDSGGPLVYNNQLIGLVSFGISSSTKYPSIYTKIYDYLSFINQSIELRSNAYIDFHQYFFE